MTVRQPSAKGAARREEILDVAMRLVAQGGARTSLRAIGRELGVEPAQILYYFGSRENLLREVLEKWDRDSNLAFMNSLSGSGASRLRDFAAVIRHNLQIRGVVHLYLSLAADSVDRQHPAHEYFRQRFSLTRATLATAVSEGQSAGLIRAHLEPERVARQLIALADGLQLQSLVDPAVDAPTDLDCAIDELFVSKATGEPTSKRS